MESVWIVEQGDYEQRGIVAVFATEELARDYCARFEPAEAPTEERLISEAVEACTHYRVQGVHPADDVHSVPWAASGRPHRSQWASNTAYCPEPVVEARIGWWSAQRKPNVYVVAEGNDQAAVEARFAGLWADVLAGHTPPAGER